MATADDNFTCAVEHFRGGHLAAAERLCLQLLAADAEHAEALHLLGLISAEVGHVEVAIEYIRRAIAASPNVATFHSNLSSLLRMLGRSDEAIASGRRAVELDPGSAAAHYNLANALQLAGDFDDAIGRYRRAIELRPTYAEAYQNLGTALLARGEFHEASGSLRLALDLTPGSAVVHYNLGLALQGLGENVEAIACFCRALDIEPRFDEALASLGHAYLNQGDAENAARTFRRFVEMQPENAQGHAELGRALYAQRRYDDAETSYRRAMLLSPNSAALYVNLGAADQALGNLDQAAAYYRQAIALDAGLPEAYNGLGSVLHNQGHIDEAIEAFDQALHCKSDYAIARSNRLSALHYRPGITLRELALAHREFQDVHAASLQAMPAGAFEWEPRSALRLGFVSGDLGRHPVGYFVIGALTHLDRRQFEIYCYSDRPVADEMTNRFRATATAWRDTSRLSDQQLAELIRSDGIDILFDLAGHTFNNRLLAFARKPAPLQITWAGYVGTTGLAAIDYILADRYEIPEGAEKQYSERVLRMPDGYVCYEPPDYAPPVSPLPALTNGHVTFGSFNNPAKLNSGVLEAWARILRRLPKSRLMLNDRWSNSPSAGSRLVDGLAGLGVDRKRIEIRNWSPHPLLLAAYGQIDVALDPFPYSGGLTTCEALWMGVPAVTYPGETFASRHSLSHLSVIGLTDTIARNIDEYVEIAVSLASDLKSLALLRGDLRRRMAASPLCDAKRFAENFAQMVHNVWRAGPLPAGRER